ncbi:MAG: hypothetical protein IID35_06625 [Planctomycetes bacterium]|nr:hypothetical protein [Planctomycetota bacterium]
MLCKFSVQRRCAASIGASLQARVVLLGVLGLMGSLSASASAQCANNDECADAFFCTIDTCINPGPSGFCVHNVRSCSDGLFCNGDEECSESRDLCEFACLDGGVCDGGVCSGGSNPGTDCSILVQPPSCPGDDFCSESLNACVECESGAACTVEPNTVCDLSSGTCVECTSNLHCLDGMFCNGSETCDLTTNTCQSGDPVQCPLPQMCSEIFLQCVECESHADCDNNSFCDGAEICQSSDHTCVDADPVVCRRCQSAEGVGDPCADDSDCPSGFTCTGASTFCSDSLARCVECLVHSDCDDVNWCTQNLCLFNACTFPHSNAGCSNGLFCDGAEVCVDQVGVCDDITGAGCCFDGPPPTLDDGFSCTDDNCDELNDVVVNAPNSAACSNGSFCDGEEVCNPSDGMADAAGCVPGITIDCSHLDTACRQGQCDDFDDVCSTFSINNGAACADDDPCTASSVCQNEVCADNPPSSDDPYRCVRLEWRNGPTAPVPVGSTVSVDLYAVADGCNLTTSTECAVDEHPVVGLTAILGWNPENLGLRESTAFDQNPDDPCESNDECFVCPADQHNWAFSGFLADCTAGDGLNYPCLPPPAVPDNDGDAGYVAISQPKCNGLPAPAACATPAGLFVTRFKFDVLSAAGGGSEIEILECAGGSSLTAVTSAAPRPVGEVTSNVTKSIGAPFAVAITCESDAECDDDNICTDDSCSCTTPGCAGTCEVFNEAVPCDDGLFCNGKNDTCSNGVCSGTEDPCPGLECNEELDRCAGCLKDSDCDDRTLCTDDSCDVEAGVCVNAPIDCSDGLACTIDSCEQVILPGPPPTLATVCHHEPDDSVCTGGTFCEAVACNPNVDPNVAPSGCTFDHECLGDNGNPCPDASLCDEQTQTCGGCPAPVVTVSGARYMTVQAPDLGNIKMALKVVGDCNDSQIACVSQFVQKRCSGGFNDGMICNGAAACPMACSGGIHDGDPCTDFMDCSGGACVGTCESGRLGSTPIFLTAADWGTVGVHEETIRPGSTYRVHATCDFVSVIRESAGTEVVTWVWGDTNGDGFANSIDITNVINGVKDLYVGETTVEGTNMSPCAIGNRVNVIDLTSSVDAVKEFPFTCPSVCP